MTPNPSLPARRAPEDRFRPEADPIVFTVDGHLVGEHAFGLDDLKRFQRHELGPMAITCMSGRAQGYVESYAGLRLTDLLDSIGFCSWPRTELKRCAVIACGLDGYQAIFSWNELYNSPLGAGVFVLYERNGTAMNEHMGTLSLISVEDQMIGPRHLRQLSGVHVQAL